MDLDLEAYWSRLATIIPHLSSASRRTAMAIYGSLAEGRAVSLAELARKLGLTAEVVAERLKQPDLRPLAYLDGDVVVGFGGLATVPMHHRLETGGTTLWTWCAWDGLFLPRLLDRRAEVVSADPISGAEVHVVVSPDRIERVEPAAAVLSFPRLREDTFREEAPEVMARFCHHVFLFESEESFDRWSGQNEESLRCDPATAFRLGQLLVEQRYGDVLPKGSNPSTTDPLLTPTLD